MRPLIVHHHLPKTAGSSLARVLQANYPGGRLAEVREPQITATIDWDNDGIPGEREKQLMLRWWRDWYASLGEAGRDRLRCVRSHAAQFLIPAVTDREVQPFTVLREPVHRMVSFYSATLSAWERISRTGSADQRPGLRTVGATIEEHGWTLTDIYEELGRDDAPADVRRAFAPFFNGQTAELLAPRLDFDDLPLPADGCDYERQALDLLAGYRVGTQDRLSESIRLFADCFEWRHAFVPRLNVGTRRREVDERTRALIRAHNAIDARLHERFSSALAGSPGVGRLEEARGRAWIGARRRLGRARRAARSLTAAR